MKSLIFSFLASVFITTAVHAHPQSILITASDIDPTLLLDGATVVECAEKIIDHFGWNYNPTPSEHSPFVHTDHAGILHINTKEAAFTIYCMHSLKRMCIDILLFNKTLSGTDQKMVQTIIAYFFKTTSMSLKTVTRS